VGILEKHYSPIEGILAVLDEGSATATNKFAVLLALIDLAPRLGDSNEIKIEEIAELLLELQWNHTDPFHGKVAPRQVTSRNIEAPVTIQQISILRKSLDQPYNFTQAKAKISKQTWISSIKAIAQMLKKNPLRKLQNINSKNFEFLYPIDFSKNTLKLYPEAKHDLIEYGGVLRQLVETRFIRFVAMTNFKTDDYSDLENYLFGADRFMPANEMRRDLYDLQKGKCVYSGEKLSREKFHVDHVIPWSKVRISHIQNFLLTTPKLNSEKTNLLLSEDLVAKWVAFEQENSQVLHQIATSFLWPKDIQIVKRSFTNLYEKAPDGTPTFNIKSIVPLTSNSRNKILELIDSLPPVK
jgi:hypothetical protein